MKSSLTLLVNPLELVFFGGLGRILGVWGKVLSSLAVGLEDKSKAAQREPVISEYHIPFIDRLPCARNWAKSSVYFVSFNPQNTL